MSLTTQNTPKAGFIRMILRRFCQSMFSATQNITTQNTSKAGLSFNIVNIAPIENFIEGITKEGVRTLNEKGYLKEESIGPLISKVKDYQHLISRIEYDFFRLDIKIDKENIEKNIKIIKCGKNISFHDLNFFIAIPYRGRSKNSNSFLGETFLPLEVTSMELM